ncbi:hypothetical protein ACROYT_G014298 [Oculina patagonica]
MATGRRYRTEEVAAAVFQDSGSEFGGDASDSDFEVSLADYSSSSDNNSDFEASLLSDHDSADSEPEPEHAAAPIPVRHPRDRQAEQIEWEVYEDFDPYESVWLQDYNERQGILVDTTNFTPVDFFHLFMPEAAFELISVETSRYAFQYFDDQGTRTLQGVLHGLLNQSCNRGKNVKIDELSQHRMLGTETKSFSKKLNSAFTLENMQKSESSSGEEVQSSKMATDISTSITSKHNKSSFAFAGLKDFLW